MSKPEIQGFEDFHNIRIKENWNDGEDCVLNLIKLHNKINTTLSNLTADVTHPMIFLLKY